MNFLTNEDIADASVIEMRGLTVRMVEVMKAIEGEYVLRDNNAPGRPSAVYIRLGDRRNGACTKTTRSLERRGLIESGPEDPYTGLSRWEITEDGYEVLKKIDELLAEMNSM